LAGEFPNIAKFNNDNYISLIVAHFQHLALHKPVNERNRWGPCCSSSK